MKTEWIFFMSCCMDCINMMYFYKYVLNKRDWPKWAYFCAACGYIILQTMVAMIMPAGIIKVFTGVLLIALFSFLYNSSIRKRLVSASSIYVFMALAEAIAVMIVVAASGGNPNELNNMELAKIIFVSHLMSFSFVQVLGYIIGEWPKNTPGKGVGGLLMLPVASILAILNIVDNGNADSWVYSIAVALLLFASNIFVFYLFLHQLKIENEQLKIAFLEKQIADSHQHYCELYNVQQETAKMRHDQKNMLLSLRYCYNNQNNTEAQGIIEGGLKKIESLNQIVNSGNPQIDAVINSKLRDLSEIKLSYSICNLDGLEIRRIDIAMIIATALDNALEACHKMKDGEEKYINIKISRQNKCIVICIQNSFDGNIKMIGNKIVSSKKSEAEHGFGLDTIKSIASQYNGTTEFMPREGSFKSLILLQTDIKTL